MSASVDERLVRFVHRWCAEHPDDPGAPPAAAGRAVDTVLGDGELRRRLARLASAGRLQAVAVGPGITLYRPPGGLQGVLFELPPAPSPHRR
ncbi:MAG: hypothetical protein S0880_15230 [Actinomycetota bacterium]|nr:hypothetical protein [Actinomycetota bacterium]